MKQCELCNVGFAPPENIDNFEKERYCSECINDPYRRMIYQIHATIGISGYTLQEIDRLNKQIEKLNETISNMNDEIISISDELAECYEEIKETR